MFNSAWLGTTEKLALVLSWTKFIRLLFFVLPFLGAGVEPFEGCGGWIGIDEFVSEIYYLKLNFFIIHPPPELLPLLGPWEWWRATFTWRGPAV